MNISQTIAALFTAAALAGYVNHRWFRLPPTIALMGFALLLSATGITLSHIGVIDLQDATAFVQTLDFSKVFLDGMLSMLLFAGALQLDLSELHRVRYSVIVMATFGVLISAFVTGALLWFAAALIGFTLPPIYALLFGALISPTDPVAVMALLKKTHVPKRLMAGIGGESLLNDGVAIVVFLGLLGVATHSQELNIPLLINEMVWTVVGGAVLGVSLGYVTSYFLDGVDEYKVEILLTLALASGGYALAGLIGASGPITVAAAGLVVGAKGTVRGTSAITRKHLYLFWELLDEILNAILFILMGLVLVIIPFSMRDFMLGLLAIPVLLIARFVSVGIPISLARFFRQVEPGTIRLLTWGGLRGGISIAMALSLPTGAQKELILAMTYIVVVFSILVQGLTFPFLIKGITAKNKEN